MKMLNFNIFTQPEQMNKPAKGKILIAEPFLQGPYFGRSIILLTEHNQDGTIGFVLNKPSDMYPDEIIEDLFSFSGELFIGGPVASNTLHFIHTLGDLIPGSIQITNNIYWGGDFDNIKELINSGTINNEQIRFFAGYSGWSPGQLEEEIEENSWVVADIDENTIMNTNVEKIWQETLAKMGSLYKTWSTFPENPTFN